MLETEMIEKVVHQNVLYAVIIRHDYSQPGIQFFTPGDFSQQLGYISHPTGHRIEPHEHREVSRNVRRTQEVLVIRKGRIRADFYSEAHVCVESRTLKPGDVILLVQGGHGFEILDACEMIEIKQGPYMGDADKIRFIPKDTTGGDER